MIQGPVVDEFQKLFMDTWAKQLGAPLAAANYFPALAAQGGEMVRAIGSTPDDPRSLIYLTLISAISKSERHIYLTNAYFVPDPQLLNALTDAARRRRPAAAARPVGRGPRLPCRALALFRAAACRRKGPRAARHDAARQDCDHRRRMVHGRLDQPRLAQLSPQRGVDAAILGREFAAQMQAAFVADLEASEAMDLERWEARTFDLRVKEWAARLREYWL
jgi:cardiolipin synthase